MDTVSVTANNRPVVGWLPSASPDVATYIILRNGTAIDTVTSSPFIDIAADASLTSYCYAVAAIDSCGNVSDTTATHCTMLLKAHIDKCKKLIPLHWTDNQDTTATGFGVKEQHSGGGYKTVVNL